MAISLNDHENRIKSFEGKLPGIENRINSLAASAKSWQVVNFREYVGDYQEIDITDKYGIKLKSNSMVTYHIITEISGGTRKYYFNITGDFFHNIGHSSQPCGLKRSGNRIYIKQWWSSWINGCIIILS